LSWLVAGKFFAACTVLLIAVAATSVYALIVAVYGKLYLGETLVGYLGFILQGCAFIALDLCLSAQCKSPVTAAVLSFGANLAVWMMDLLASAAPQWLERALSFLSLYSRNEPFLMGQLSYASVLYDLSFAAAFLALTVFVMDRRRDGR
jgi:ABC-2 type transport system permease protein